MQANRLVANHTVRHKSWYPARVRVTTFGIRSRAKPLSMPYMADAPGVKGDGTVQNVQRPKDQANKFMAADWAADGRGCEGVWI
jgi:hypothetical protein